MRQVWKVQVHGVYAAPDPSLVLGVQPGVFVLSPEPGGLSHLHVPSQRRVLPLHRGRGRGRLLRRQAVFLFTLKLLRTLVLHGGHITCAAMPYVLFARRGLCQALTEMLRQPQTPGLPMQKCSGLQGGRGQELSSGEASLMM